LGKRNSEHRDDECHRVCSFNFLLRGPMIDPKEIEQGTRIAQSALLPRSVWLPRLVPQTLLHFRRDSGGGAGSLGTCSLGTTFGYRIRAVGLNIDAAKYAGINVPVYQGAGADPRRGLAGLAGSIEVMGVQHRMMENLARGTVSGHCGSAVRSLHPLGAIPASVTVRRPAGWGDKMQRAVQGAFLFNRCAAWIGGFFVVGSQIWSRRRARGGKPMDELFSMSVLTGILYSASGGTPYIFAAIGETFAQRSGVLNLGVDGIMLMGAYSGFFVG